MKTPMDLRRILLQLVMAVGLGPIMASVGAVHADQTNGIVGFKVTGTVSQLILSRTNVSQSVAEAHLPFVLVAVEGAWDLTLSFAYGTHRYASDGTNVLELFFDPKMGQYPTPAVIHEDGFPSRAIHGIAWLAYGSAKYLDAMRPVAAPWVEARHDPRAFMYEARVTRLSEPPGLPMTVDFFSRRSWRKQAMKHPALQVEGVMRKAMQERKAIWQGVAEGFHVAVYRVIETTNVGPYLIPTHAEMALHRPGSEAGSLAVASRYIVHADDVQPVFAPLALPALGEHGASVSDRRFQSSRQGIDNIQYHVAEAWIVDKNDPHLGALFEKKKRQAPFLRLSLFQDAVVRSVFALLAVLPAIVWWIVRKRRIRSQKT